MSKLRTALLLLSLLASQFLLPDRDRVAHAQQASINAAVPAVVRILGCNVAGCNVGLGSGVLIHPSGVVLTANHVTLADLNDPTSQLEDFLIEMTTSAQLPPQPRYRARLISFKPESDLALLRIYWDEIANRPVDVTTLSDLPTLPLADAETVMLGEAVHILGYPLAGGRAVNYIRASVSGFDEDGALVKISTTLSEGNSGGPVLVERNGHFEIAGVVLRRRGTLGEVGLSRRIDQLQEMIWLANAQRVWVDNIQVNTQGTGATASLQISAEIHALDMVNRHIYLLAYAFEADTYRPWRPTSTGLSKSATGQVVFSQEFVAQQVVESAQTITLEQHGLGVDPQQLRFRLLLWDSEATQVLWQDTEWRSPQPATAVALAPPTPTVTQTAIPTPVLLPPTASPAPPTATATVTPIPDLIASATAIAQMLATSIAATQTALPTDTPTSTPTPNLAATTTAEAHRRETAIAATLTAQPTVTPTPTEALSFEQEIATAVAATLTALPTNTPTQNIAAPIIETAVAASDIKIGLVTDVGRINDRSFNQSAWEGVKQAGTALGLTEGDDYKYIETQDSTDYANNIQQFVDAGYKIIVTVGFALGEATITAAKANPEVTFIGVDQFQGEALPNVIGLIFHEDQSGFLAGALAAQLSKTGIIAAVLGSDIVPPVVAFKEGYELGAKYINNDIAIISTYHPGDLSRAFSDPEWGAAIAKQALDQGADVIFGAGGNTGNGALQEAAAAASNGANVWCIGVDTDQWGTLEPAHPCLVSSAMKLITPGIVDIIDQIAEGTAQGGNYFGGAGLAPFHDFDSKIDQAIKDKLAVIDKRLKDGSLKTGYYGQ